MTDNAQQREKQKESHRANAKRREKARERKTGDR